MRHIKWMAMGGSAAVVALIAPTMTMAAHGNPNAKASTKILRSAGPKAPGPKNRPPTPKTLAQEITAILELQASHTQALAGDATQLSDLTTQQSTDVSRVAEVSSQQASDATLLSATSTQQRTDVSTIAEVYAEQTSDVAAIRAIQTQQALDVAGVQSLQQQAGPMSKMFLQNGTYTVPTGVSMVWVRAQGGGGGGISSLNGPRSVGGNQGGWGQAILPVSSGEVLTVTVGNGGAEGISSGYGGTSTLAVDGTAVVSATGGSDGSASTTPYGGTFTVVAPAEGISETVGATTSTPAGAGPTGFFGSGGGFQTPLRSSPGVGGYVVIQPMG